MEREFECRQADDPETCSLEPPECDFGELIDLLGIHKSTLSHHLKELNHADLIETRKEGRYLSIRVNRKRIRQLKNFFEIEPDQKIGVEQ